ncbi:MAG: hypothetical protein AAF702_37205 [Chloroflexota bacterium]
MSSDSLIPTFSYQAAADVSGELRLFIKRQMHVESREAPYYHTAQKANIPTPAYYGHLNGSNGEEILFLEFLPECGVDEQKEAEICDLVSLMACINTAPLRCTEFKVPEPITQEEQVGEMWQYAEQYLIPKLQEIWGSATLGEVGTENQVLCRQYPDGPRALKAYAFALTQQAASIPKDALIQPDAGAHQMGWRMTSEGKRLVVFDLDWKIGRRFYDIGYILHNYLDKAILSKAEIATHYLKEYTRWGGEETALQDFLSMTQGFADEDKLWSCPWLWDMARKQLTGNDPSFSANGNNFPAWLHQYLRSLLESAKQQEMACD